MARKDGWTGEVRRRFIEEIGACDSRSAALREVGKSEAGLRRLLERDQPFAEIFDAAWEHGREERDPVGVPYLSPPFVY